MSNLVPVTDPISPAQLDCPPPTLTRRQAVAGAAIGLGTLALPTAASAASGIGSALFSPSYGETDGVVASWVGFDNSSGFENGVNASTSNVPVSASLVGGGTTFSTTVNFNPVNPEISVSTGRAPGEFQVGFVDWKMRNGSSSIDVSNSPHLEFRISVSSGLLTLKSLVFYKVRKMGTNTLRIAAYVSTNNFATSSLRRTAELVQQERHLVVDLGISGTPLSPGTTARVRLFPYSTPATEELRLRAYNNEGTAAVPLSSPTDDVKASVGDRTGAAASYIAAFIGTYSS